MKLEYIDGTMLKNMTFSSAQLLEENKQTVDALNVFPVPDGDTGTNMSMTLRSAVNEMDKVDSNSISDVAKAISLGALKGARGNSGVILSQIFRGIANGLDGKDKVNTVEYAEALKAGADTAYKAVMKPIEGTMLTVIRVTAQEAQEIAKEEKDFAIFYKKIIDVARATLEKTPDMLPELKQAGVVDSGGMGLLYIFIGASEVLSGEGKTDYSNLSFKTQKRSIASQISDSYEDKVELKYKYCTEFIIYDIYPYINEYHIEKLRLKLTELGDSLVFVTDDDIIKVHIHTNAPGQVLQLGLEYGELSAIKIDNMSLQHRELEHITEQQTEEKSVKKKFTKKMGIVSVAIGDGIVSIFKDLSADYVVEGGQTMNPSIDDILKAIDEVDAEEIFILPNNSNIILSARQAAEMSNRKIHVIPSKSIPQGLAAMIAYNPDVDVDTNIKNMIEALDTVITGQVTYAIRDSNFDGMTINKDDIIGICDGKILVVDNDISDATKKLIDKMLDDNADIITLYYGADVSEKDAQSIAEYISEKYLDIDVEIYPGKQPLYYYIISVE